MTEQATTAEPVTTDDPRVISYLTLRKAIGLIGLLLPFVLVIGTWILARNFPTVQSSISSYYYSAMGNVLVGSLCATGFFLWSYKGYVRDPSRLLGFRITDNLVSNVAAISAIGVALFPTPPGRDATTLNEFTTIDADLVGLVHVTSAAFFFFSLAIMSLCLFTKGEHPRQNLVYKVCGWFIIGCMVAIFLVWFVPTGNPFKEYGVFVLETVAILAFGVSWFTKGIERS